MEFPCTLLQSVPWFCNLNCPFPSSTFPRVSREGSFVKGNQISQKGEHLGQQQQRNTAYSETLQNLVKIENIPY